jgi:hypothetical protein
MTPGFPLVTMAAPRRVDGRREERPESEILPRLAAAIYLLAMDPCT